MILLVKLSIFLLPRELNNVYNEFPEIAKKMEELGKKQGVN